MAGAAGVWGLLTLVFYDQGAIYVALGAAQILYALFTAFALLRDGAAFSRSRS